MPKRNAQGSGSIRQRKDGRWEARYTTGRDPGTGKQVQKSVYGKTQKEVRQKLTQISASIDEGTYTEPSRYTVGSWLDKWINNYNPNVKERTLFVYKGHINYRIKPSIGAIKLSALKTDDIQYFINQQEKPTKGKTALSPKSITDIFSILHKALEQAVKNGYIKINPSNACNLPDVEKANIKPLSNTEMSDLLNAIKGHPYEILYMVTLFTGLRQGEIMALSWDCLQGNTLFIYRQLQLIEGTYKFVSLKNGKTRRITPAPSVMQALQKQKWKQSELRLKAGEAWSNEDNLIFTNELGKHLARQTIYKQFKQIVSDLGIPKTRFHDLRHAYAVASLQSGDDIKTLQSNMGHHSAAFTLDQYGHVTDEMNKKSADRMERFIKGL